MEALIFFMGLGIGTLCGAWAMANFKNGYYQQKVINRNFGYRDSNGKFKWNGII